ncbi:hypothetical protein [Streptomyces flavofungini]|uniref:Uncharacterized protein n=1 Tax=Streptomyces flavofungini TaxID=68200 RepID=A0ABS0X1Q0_9ACTN|nr:hypothetical protein [Streptomyces flavofungini]MBJ3807068.1 hypothetical protein [Streptomyces flavofungini]GHC75202.1 hypothetical protein GCM10010349_54240 [Streptomyces flavofungini]
MTAPRDETADPYGIGVRVRGLLAAAGLPAGGRETAGLVAAYGVQRPAMDALFDVAEARYEQPVLRRDVHVPRA